MKVDRNNIVPLVRQIKAGMIHRAQFPELWPTTLEPVEVQAADRRRMIREVLRGGIDSEAYPDLWERLHVIVTTHDGEELYNFFTEPVG